MFAEKSPKIVRFFGVGVASSALALTLVLTGCGGGNANSASSSSTTEASASASASTSAATDTSTAAAADSDLLDFYHGQWRGSVEITGQTVYGSAGGNEQMLDVNLEADGSCTVVPLEAHADLLNDEGTWTTDGSNITMTLGKGDVKLKIVDDATLEGAASDFDIADFDTIKFDFYG
ncbi:MAG: hypothetical protein IJ125_00015 [Atopobiaceae bacterium]|nr:hypothetical protein [Atopobiaceae bacterium]